MADLEEELKIFWDKLPIDTVIATILDPRTKKFHKIPPNEIGEAVKILKSVCLQIKLSFDIFLITLGIP